MDKRLGVEVLHGPHANLGTGSLRRGSIRRLTR
jgi:hypothetical protein